MENFVATQLSADDSGGADSVIQLLMGTYPGITEKYSRDRLVNEIVVSGGWNYRTFFVAHVGQKLVGVGGIKAADWASNTHLMFLSAVDIDHRGVGIGGALEQARITWVKENHVYGRILVSTKHDKRFVRYGFKSISEVDGRHMMCLEFGRK